MMRQLGLLLLLSLFSITGSSAHAQDISGPPYEGQMVELAKALGSLHYLSNLCGDKSSQWRDRMTELLTTEKADNIRRKNLVSAFNNNYRTYAETYSQCTKQALKAIERFKTKGAQLTDNLVTHYGN